MRLAHSEPSAFSILFARETGLILLAKRVANSTAQVLSVSREKQRVWEGRLPSSNHAPCFCRGIHLLEPHRMMLGLDWAVVKIK